MARPLKAQYGTAVWPCQCWELYSQLLLIFCCYITTTTKRRSQLPPDDSARLRQSAVVEWLDCSTYTHSMMSFILQNCDWLTDPQKWMKLGNNCKPARMTKATRINNSQGNISSDRPAGARQVKWERALHTSYKVSLYEEKSETTFTLI